MCNRVHRLEYNDTIQGGTIFRPPVLIFYIDVLRARCEKRLRLGA